MLPTPEFFYFDLGRVLLDFEHARAHRQLAALAGIEEAAVAAFLVTEGRQEAYEAGRLTTDELVAAFCDRAGCRPSHEALMLAAGDIFTPMPETIEIVEALHAAGHPLGILSNTCECHWQVCVDGRFPFLGGPLLDRLFRSIVLSYEERAVKPERAIFEIAARRVGLPPEKIFFVDDLEANVAGARAAGFDAVRFSGARQLRDDLRRRGVRL